MKNAVADVFAFHLACGVPILDVPTIPPCARTIFRISLIDEEVNKELIPALREGNMPAIADGIADAIYVLIGAALEYGIPLETVWQSVQTANMAKVDPVTGKVRRRADSKILKPLGWVGPDIEGILHRAGASPLHRPVALP